MTVLVDQHGRPIRREVLTQEVAGPTLAAVRSAYGGYPADGLTPVRLANILREADQGDPMRYLELAEQIEERDLHYLGVLSTRKRAVAQVDVTVEAASDAPDDVAMADMVREWISRDELSGETFDMLDAIGKGISFTEIIWDTSEGQWRPERLEWRDPRWFTVDRADGRTPMLRGGIEGNGADTLLDPYKFVLLNMRAKSGLPIRSGLARVAAWAWMFKAFTQRDWAVFAQTFGQPVRIGKYATGASKEDRATLFRAVANIAGDCAAIIPEGMMIEFVESKNVGSGSDLYERRADWLDRQISKAILGQTTTTDAISGGHAVSREHRQVQEDIEAADCKDLAAALNRDLVRPWINLERGPQRRYPRIVIARPKKEDLKLLADAVPKLVACGMRIQASEVRDKFGLSDPDPGAELLQPARTAPDPAGMLGDLMDRGVPLEQALQSVERLARIAQPGGGERVALMRAGGDVASPFPADAIGDRLVRDAAADMAELLGTIEAMMAAATSLDELRTMLLSAYPQLDTSPIADKLAQGMIAAHVAGRSDLEDESA